MKTAKLQFSASMFIVGTIGIFVKYLPFSSSEIALFRGILGAFSILCYALLTKKTISIDRVKSDVWILLASGVALGINWILLFQAYRYTSVSIATVCYYMAPVIVLLLSPILLHEKLTVKKTMCIFSSLIGVIFISGIGKSQATLSKGVLYGLLAACFYATVIILNKKLKRVNGIKRSIFQLSTAAISLLPYVLFTTTFHSESITARNLLLLLVIGVVHTGVVYLLYFSSMEHIKAQTIAVLSYIDPVVAILLSALLLKESFGLPELIGSVLIIGSSYISEK